MDSTKNRRALVDEALSNLGALVVGQTPSNEDLSTVDGMVDAFLRQLASDQVVTIANDEEIPADIFLPLGRLLANLAGPKYGLAINRESEIVDRAEIKRIIAARPTYEVLQTEFF